MSLRLVKISPTAPTTSPCTRELLALHEEVLGEALQGPEGRTGILAVCVADVRVRLTYVSGTWELGWSQLPEELVHALLCPVA